MHSINPSFYRGWPSDLQPGLKRICHVWSWDTLQPIYKQAVIAYPLLLAKFLVVLTAPNHHAIYRDTFSGFKPWMNLHFACEGQSNRSTLIHPSSTACILELYQYPWAQWLYNNFFYFDLPGLASLLHTSISNGYLVYICPQM